MNEFEKQLIQVVEDMYEIAKTEHSDVLKLYKKTQDNILEFFNLLFLKYGNDGTIAYSDLYKYNRLQSVESFLQNELETLQQQENNIVYDILLTIYTATYYRNAYSFEQALGSKGRYSKLTPAFITSVIEKNWSGVIFSQRIKDNHTSLSKKLLSDFSQSIRLSEPISKIKKKVEKELGIRYNHSKTLMNTESARVIASSQEKLFNDSGVVEGLEFTAVLDNRTTEYCREHDGYVYRIDDPERPELPAHAYCRSCWLPVLINQFNINPNASFDNFDEWFGSI